MEGFSPIIRKLKTIVLGLYSLLWFFLMAQNGVKRRCDFSPETGKLRIQNHQDDKGREYAWTLEGFSTYPIIVDINEDVISFPPIINGVLTTVTEATTNIFLDITGLDLDGCKYALNIIATLLAERGGEIYSVTVEYPDKYSSAEIQQKILELSQPMVAQQKQNQYPLELAQQR